MKIKISIKVTERDIEDILITAFEGGIDYWCDYITNLKGEAIHPINAIAKSYFTGKMQKNDQKPFQQAQLSLFFDVKTADNLFVITNYKNQIFSVTSKFSNSNFSLIF